MGFLKKGKAKQTEKDAQKPQPDSEETVTLSDYDFHQRGPSTAPDGVSESQALAPVGSSSEADKGKGKEVATSPASDLQLAPYPAAVSSSDASDNPYLQLLALANMFREAVRTLPRSVATFRAIIRCPNCWVRFPVSFSTTVEVPQGSAKVSVPPPPPSKVPPQEKEGKEEQDEEGNAKGGPSRCFCDECGEEMPEGSN